MGNMGGPWGGKRFLHKLGPSVQILRFPLCAKWSQARYRRLLSPLPQLLGYIAPKGLLQRIVLVVCKGNDLCNLLLALTLDNYPAFTTRDAGLHSYSRSSSLTGYRLMLLLSHIMHEDQKPIFLTI